MFSVLSLLSQAILATSFVSAIALHEARSGSPTYYKDLPYNFTLAAINTTLPNANLTGAPLVLGEAGAVDGATFQVSSTYASFPYNSWPALALVNSSIHAFETNGGWYTNATECISGSPLSWLTTGYYPPYAATGYNAIMYPGSELAVLSWYGNPSLWSLCPVGEAPYIQVNVIYNITADIPPPPYYLGFDPADCYPVNLNIIPA